MPRIAVFLLCAASLFAQSDTGELRVKVTDQAGLPVPSKVELVSEANQVRQTWDTESDGTLILKRLTFGVYRIRVSHAGFASASQLVDVRSAIPKELRVTLGVAPIETTVVVSETATLLDPYRTGDINRIGAATIANQLSTQPGRSLIDIVDTQPGWLLEANGVLHPRGSEYQTQYIVDGMPLTENRSPAFAPELEADDVQSDAAFSPPAIRPSTAASWAASSRWTRRRMRSRDFTAKATAYGGSFDTAGGDLSGPVRLGPQHARCQPGRGLHRRATWIRQWSRITPTPAPTRRLRRTTSAIWAITTASASSFATASHASKCPTKWCSRRPASARTADGRNHGTVLLRAYFLAQHSR